MKKQNHKKYRQTKELVIFGLNGIPKEGVPELKLRFNKGHKVSLGKITQSSIAADLIRRLYVRGSIELQEAFIVLYLNQQSNVIGYYRHTVGNINMVMVDIRLIMGAALKCAAVGMILSHNHPSGNPKPSEADKTMTRKVEAAAKIFDIQVLDHVIVTKESFYSFADEGLIGG